MAHPPLGESDFMKRPWFRIHLSTAIALMLAGSLLIWVNTRTTSHTVVVEVGKSGAQTFSDQLTTSEYGWPFQATEHRKVSEYISDSSMRFGDLSCGSYTRMEWKPVNLAVNIAIALLILVSLATLCEWRIRRNPPARTS